MKLDNLYSLRRNFTVIGLTGRTGSGCTTIANLLAGSYSSLNDKGLRDLRKFNSETLFYRKYNILKKYMSHSGNWTRFDKIRYIEVIILFMFNKYGNKPKFLRRLIIENFKESKTEDNQKIAGNVFNKIKVVHLKHQKIVNEIISLGDLSDSEIKNSLMENDGYSKLNAIFFSKEFKQFCFELNKALVSEGYFRRTLFFHKIACNIRQSGDPLNNKGSGIENIYTIAKIINLLIKVRKKANGSKPTKIVIDSLRNSLEIMFFKERYSAFYMLATKDVIDNSTDRIKKRLLNHIKDENEVNAITKKMLLLDETEYKTGDFAKGTFSSPDVENCIQKSDFHILNLKKEDISEFLDKYPNLPYGDKNFITREEQLLKLIALINQPGIITPSSLERSMQIANTAKLNSGCISRSVGAAITDSDFYIKSVGWNDVAKGHTPCNLRNINDLITPKSQSWLNTTEHYSEFEKGNTSAHTTFKYKEEENVNRFNIALKDYFEDSYNKNKEHLNGKNCSFCFKTVHNHYEGEANQVHTRSLHAEENAMLQITKLGGQGVKDGILFTTASPCELCSKKAYQLGIKTIYFIDPYPGISNDQILKGGTNRPTMVPFSGAIGNAYHKLFDSFMSYKDEISMTLELKPKNKLSIQFKSILKSLKSNGEVKKFLDSGNNLSDDDVIEIIEKAIKEKQANE
jgi:deoxycytidylate deaminase